MLHLLLFVLFFVGLATRPVKILIAVTNHDALGDTGKKTGYWLAEVAHPYHVFTSRYNWTVDFISPKGGHAPVDPGSVDAAKSGGDTVSLDFYNNKAVMSRLDATLAPIQLSLPVLYDAIFFAGGHGVDWDFPQANDLGAIATSIYADGGIVSAVCHGPAGLFSVRDPYNPDQFLINGRNVTGFSNAEEQAVGMQGIVPFSLEDMLKKLGGKYSRAPQLWQSYVVVDGNIVTGENPQSSVATAEAVAMVIRRRPPPPPPAIIASETEEL